MRKLLKNNHGDMDMIVLATIMAITFAIGIVVVYNVYGALDTGTIDDAIKEARGYAYPADGTSDYNNTQAQWNNTVEAGNASLDLLSNTQTFFTVAPIVLIVVAAVGILGYVMLLRRRG